MRHQELVRDILGRQGAKQRAASPDIMNDKVHELQTLEL